MNANAADDWRVALTLRRMAQIGGDIIKYNEHSNPSWSHAKTLDISEPIVNWSKPERLSIDFHSLKQTKTEHHARKRQNIVMKRQKVTAKIAE